MRRLFIAALAAGLAGPVAAAAEAITYEVEDSFENVAFALESA
ncbi:DUF302 domain-containing protein, partial [Candidatus Falkowbacteria bacterium]|nr:DUF302 domain-containing protein [Candidatus Falkowbacteria bacterium]